MNKSRSAIALSMCLSLMKRLPFPANSGGAQLVHRASATCSCKVVGTTTSHRVGKSARESQCTLKTLREYWQGMKPKTYLFPGMMNNWRADK